MKNRENVRAQAVVRGSTGHKRRGKEEKPQAEDAAESREPQAELSQGVGCGEEAPRHS